MTDVSLPVTLLSDAFGRVAGELPDHLEGLTPEQVRWRADTDANPIGWLTWHLARVQDDHLAGVGEVEQVWTSQGWAQRFGLPYDDGEIGYGHTSEQVAAFDVTDTEVLAGYYAAVHEMTLQVLESMASAGDFDRVVDREWTPHVTAGVRLVSVLNDVTAHLGQVAYLRGLLDRQG